MSELNHSHHKPDHDRDSKKQGHSSYWKFAHRDWRFLGWLDFDLWLDVHLLGNARSVVATPYSVTTAFSRGASSEIKRLIL